MITRRFYNHQTRHQLFCHTSTNRIHLHQLPLLALSNRTAFFVHHKKTPNADCMMFVVPNVRFRVGNQTELERAIKEANDRKYGINQQNDDEEDWDGPGPNLVGNKTSQETKEEKIEKARKIAVEQFQVRRKEYFAQRDTNQDGTSSDNGQNTETRQQRKGTSLEEEAAACDVNAETEKSFLDKVVFMPKSRTGGSSVHRAASMPTKKSTAGSSAENSSSESGAAEEVSPLPSGFLDDNDESTYVNATYSFTKETMHLSPLARRVFECEAGANVTEVVVGRDFLTVRRKSEADLLLEKEIEAEEEALRKEQQQQEGDGEGNGNKNIMNDGQGEIIATSLGTLSGMVNKTPKKKTTDENQNREEKKQTEVNETRDKLSQMYKENEETTSRSNQQGDKNQSDSQENEKTSSDDSAVLPPPPSDSVIVAEWFDLQFPITAAVTDHLHFAEVAVDLSAPHPYADTEPNPEDSDVISSIKELISEHLRPLLQSDGGDLRFHGFFPDEGAIIKVEMLGSCKTCKKSDTTLRDLIERTIKHFVPEVAGVEEINGKLAKKTKKEEEQEEAEA